jgi:hypothetical protein
MNKLLGRLLCAAFGHRRRRRSVGIGDGSNDIMVCPRCWAMREVKPRVKKASAPT